MDQTSALSGSGPSSRRGFPRRRVDRACNNCRRRKERCNGAKPRCSNCQTSSRECHYDAESKKRGLPEGWVHALEKLLAIALSREPHLEQDLISILRANVPNPQQDGFAALWTDETDGRGLFKQWRRSHLAQQLESMLPDLEGLPRPAMSDSASQALFLSRSLRQSEAEQRMAAPAISDEGTIAQSGTSENNLDIYLSSDMNSLQLHLVSVSLPPGSLELIDLYFASTHVWFPILEKHEIYRTYHKWPDKAHDTDTGLQLCLLAIVSYQEAQHHRFEETLTADGGGSSDDLFQRLKTCILARRGECSLAHVQALLILSLQQLGAGFCNAAWLLLGQATRMALLMKSPSSVLMSASASMIGSSNRRLQHVLFGCFILDTLLSFAIDQPAHVRRGDLRGLPYLDEDGLEEWSAYPESSARGLQTKATYALSTFNHLIKTTEVFSNVAGDQQERDHLRAIEDELSFLDDLHGAANHLNLSDNIDVNGHSLPHQTTVQLLRLAAKLILILHGVRLRSLASVENTGLPHVLTSIGSVLAQHKHDWDARSTPLLWYPILSVVVAQLDQARTLYGFIIPNDVAATLMNGIPSGQTSWKCFRLLHSEAMQALVLQDPSVTDSTASDPAQLNLQTPFMPETLSSTASQNLQPSSELGMHQQQARVALSQSGFRIDTYTTDTTNGNGVTDVAADTVPISDLVLMDAVNWDNSWQQSFLGLGFSQLEEINDGMPDMFQNTPSTSELDRLP